MPPLSPCPLKEEDTPPTVEEIIRTQYDYSKLYYIDEGVIFNFFANCFLIWNNFTVQNVNVYEYKLEYYSLDRFIKLITHI